MSETKVVCPKCGCEIAIPNHEHLSAGIVIGKDSGLGTVVLPAANTNSTSNTNSNSKTMKTNKVMSEKIAALKAAGVNTENIVSISGGNGGEMLGRLIDGVISVIPENDPIFAKIKAFGTIPERRLFRRWVAKGVMEFLIHKNWYDSNFTRKLQNRGYMYGWKVLIQELNYQQKFFINDMENYHRYNRGYNKDVAYAMAKDFIEKLAEYCKNRKVHYCKGREYIKVKTTDVFVDELKKRYFNPLSKLAVAIDKAETPAELYNAVLAFYHKMPYMDFRNSKAFIDAYKFTGAYFTMDNFIKFSGYFLWDDNGKKLNKQDSIKFLNIKAEEYKNDGWKLFGLLRKFLEDNGIDPEKKMDEWRKAKMGR